jgi:hypothetical protein
MSARTSFEDVLSVPFAFTALVPAQHSQTDSGRDHRSLNQSPLNQAPSCLPCQHSSFTSTESIALTPELTAETTDDNLCARVCTHSFDHRYASIAQIPESAIVSTK